MRRFSRRYKTKTWTVAICYRSAPPIIAIAGHQSAAFAKALPARYSSFMLTPCAARMSRRGEMRGVIAAARIRGRAPRVTFRGACFQFCTDLQYYRRAFPECSQSLLRKVQADRSGHATRRCDDGAHGRRQYSQCDSKRGRGSVELRVFAQRCHHEASLVKAQGCARRSACASRLTVPGHTFGILNKYPFIEIRRRTAVV